MVCCKLRPNATERIHMSNDMLGTIERVLARAAARDAKSQRKSTKSKDKATAKSKAATKSKVNKTTELEHTCPFGETDDGTPLTGSYAACVACHAETAVDSYWQPQAWKPPVALDVFVKANFRDIFDAAGADAFKTRNTALDCGQSDMVIAYDRYVSNHFNEAVDASAIDLMTRKVESRKLAKLGNLALLGLASDDIVQIALWWATIDRFVEYQRSTGADEATVTLWSRALRDRRLDFELQEVSDSEPGDGYYIFRHVTVKDDHGTNMPVSQIAGIEYKGSNHADVRKAREYLAAREELRPLLATLARDFAPRIGDTYRLLRHVERAGYREFGKLVGEVAYEDFATGIDYVSGLSVGDTVDESLFNRIEVPESPIREGFEFFTELLDSVVDNDLDGELTDAVVLTELMLTGHSIDATCKFLSNLEDKPWSLRRLSAAARSLNDLPAAVLAA